MNQRTPVKRETQTAVAAATAADSIAKLHPVEDAVEYLEAFAKQRPTAVAIWCFAIGFVLGWRLKPW